MSGTVQQARRVAFQVINAVAESDAYANLLLPVAIERAGIRDADARLATELAYGTLRQQGYYDRIIEIAAARPITSIDPKVLSVLRMATHQLVAMRVASHAAVDEAVSLAREVGSRSAAGFVNAVLRAITRTTPEEWKARVVGEQSSDDDRLAAGFSHPVWIVRAFRRALAAEGREDELAALLEADNRAPLVTMAALPGLSSRNELTGATPGRFSPFAAISAGGDPSRWPAVREGRARVQDEGSQLAALALARAKPVETGERWLDLCAGPGGKAAMLEAEARLGGAILTANELLPARAQLVRSALSAFTDPAEVLEHDGREIGSLFPGRFDRILLDAPCTGLGALRRRPEARWRKQPKDVPELTALQSELLSSAVGALAPGGILAYVTCSPHRAETSVIVDAAVKRFGLEQLETAAVLDSIAAEPLDVGNRFQVQLWPHRHGTDAMFIALLRRP